MLLTAKCVGWNPLSVDELRRQLRIQPLTSLCR